MDSYVIAILKLLYENDKNKVLTDLKRIIKEFDLRFDDNETKKQIIKINYEKLKENFNEQKNKFDYNSLIKLFVLVIFGFNSQIRFNKNNEFNIPAGKQSLNSNREKILLNFVDQIQSRNIDFQNKDFRFVYELLKDNKINEKDFFYFDPPYFIANATYNLQWSKDDENDLLNLLDELNNQNIKWALSNVLESNGKTHFKLKEWSKKYNVFHLRKNYLNSNYQRRNKGIDKEVLITNYEIK
ncbi:hypothetical protein PR243_00805 [Metamycoplasma hyosynoviae]|nr:DNA adenine methylase [Metamycoplasma hyosynoviae]MDC8937120.1 hypothetical protein [Metamycoplasma hyosynoviae]